MKKVIIVLCLSFLPYACAYSQFSFSVKPGLNLNGANFGYQIKNMKPYIGYQMYGFISINKSISGVTTSDYTTTVNVSMPFVGAKYEIIKKEKLASSINLTLFKPIIFGRSADNGEVNDSFREDINKLSVWGSELGFGSEYFFDEHFSLGGEFGFRFGNYRMRDENVSSDRIDIQNVLYNTSYTAISFNFYY